MDDAGAWITDALVKSIILGWHAKEFLNFVFGVELECFLFAHPRFGVRLRIVESNRQLQRIAIDSAISFFDAGLIADRISKMIEPGSLVKPE